MAWLVEEILDSCPDLRYREFRVLVALAWDAGKNRQCKPGMALIARRANCAQRSVTRCLRSLSDRGLIRVVQAGSPGRNATYEILPMPSDRGQHDGASDSGQRRVASDSGQKQPERTPRTVSSSSEMLPSEASSSAAHAHARDPRLAQLLLGLGASEAQAELIAARLHDDPGIHSPYTYVLAIVGDGQGEGEAWLGRMLADLAAQDPGGDPRPHPGKPPWCGECDERTRLIELADGPARCIRCHPLSVSPPGGEPASSAWLKPWCGRCDPVSRWAEAGQPDGTVKLTRCPDCGERR
jgi:hypothetical protein